MPKIVDHEVRREEISEHAAALIAQGGMDAATIREIAQRSGYSKGVIEHYFDNKDELISGALDWANKCYEQRVVDTVGTRVGLSALSKRIQATLPLNRSVRDEWKVRMVFWGMAAVDEELRQRQEERFGKAVEFYAGDISSAMKNGEIPRGSDVRLLAQRLFASTIGVSIMALYNAVVYDEALLLRESEHLMSSLFELENQYVGV